MHLALFVRRISKIQITFYLIVQFKENFDSILSNLDPNIMTPNPTDSTQIADFIKRLNKIMLLVGGLSLSFDHETTTLIKRFISPTASKLPNKKLRELEALWLTS